MKAALLTLLLALAPSSGLVPREGAASLEGIVVEQGTGRPVARARALLAKGGSLDPLDPKAPKDPKDALAATTDGAGKFAIHDIPSGVYRLFIGHSDYVPAEYGQRAPGKPGALLVLIDGETMNVHTELIPAASVQGKVVNQVGVPVPRFVVKVFRAQYEQGERVFRGGEYAVTEENGEFRLFGLAPGWYFLRAVPSEEYAVLPLNMDVVDWPAYYGGATEDDSKPIRLEPGRVFEVGTLVTTRGPAARVRGQAVNALTGRPEPDVRILLGRQRRSGVETSGLSAPSLKTGFFELAGAAPGNYVIDAVTPSLAGSATFQARGSDIENVNVLLYPRVNVKGRVRLEGKAKDSLGNGFGNVRVVLDAGRTAIDAAVDANGMFTLVNVPVGDYRLSLSGAPPNVYIQTARAGSVDVLENGVHVDAKLAAPFELALSSASSVLAVIALDAQRQSVPGAVVALVPQATRQLELFRSALADGTGNARFEGIAPGTYRMYSWEYIEENAWQDPDILKAYEKNGETVIVQEAGISIATVTVNSP